MALAAGSAKVIISSGVPGEKPFIVISCMIVIKICFTVETVIVATTGEKDGQSQRGRDLGKRGREKKKKGG